MNQMEELEQSKEKLEDQVAELKDEVEKAKKEGANTTVARQEEQYLKDELH